MIVFVLACAYSPLVGIAVCARTCSGLYEQSEEQARANKEAGSRLLEYINRGGVANGALPEPRQDSQAKQPLQE